MRKSQITCAIWPWGTKTKEQMETALKEISAIGYKSFESVKQSIYAFDLNAKEYQSVLDKYGVKSESFYFHIPAKGQEHTVFDTIERELDFVAQLGITRATLQATAFRPENNNMDEKEKAENLAKMVKFAKIAKKFGIKTNVHPHVDTFLMYEDEIDYVMQNSDKDLIYFAPDTAHIAAADADPVAVIKKYADRVNFTHLKDYKLGEAITYGGWVDSGVPVVDCFHGLGDGTVNFAEVFKILESVNYSGPLCVELDSPPISNADSAKKNYDFVSKFVKD